MLKKTLFVTAISISFTTTAWSDAVLEKFPGQVGSSKFGYHVIGNFDGTFRGNSGSAFKDIHFSVYKPNGQLITSSCESGITGSCSKKIYIEQMRGIWKACAWQNLIEINDCGPENIKSFEVQNAPTLHQPNIQGATQTYSSLLVSASGTLDQNFSLFGKQGYYVPQFHWVLPDGELRQGSTITTSFAEPGNYTFHVKAFDGVHYSEQKSVTISIAPSADYISVPYLNVEYGRGTSVQSTFFVDVSPGQYGNVTAIEREYSSNGSGWVSIGNRFTIPCGTSATVRARVSNGVRWSGYTTQNAYANRCGTVTQPR